MARFAIAVALLLSAVPAAAEGAGLEVLRPGYQQLFAGEPAAAHKYFESLLAPAPDDLTLRLGSLVARSELIQNDEGLLPAYERDLDALIAMAGRRYSRSNRDTEALHHLATAHMLRAAYRFEFDKGMWGAARDAANAKNHSDDYVTLHPEHADAYLALGLYNYYVGIAPSLFKVMRLFLFLPAGDRAAGLRQLERAARDGDLVAPMAQQNLIEIYSELEGRGPEAVALAERLQQRFPENDSFGMTAAAVFAGPVLEDHDRAAGIYAAIAKRRQNDASLQAIGTRHRALLALAGERVEQARVDEAIAVLTPVVDAHPQKPVWIVPQFLLRRGNFRALINETSALDDLTRVEREFKSTDWAETAADIRTWMNERRASGEAAEYAALLAANRLAAERRWTEARRAYEAVLAQQPASTWAQYRLALVTFKSGPPERATAAFTALAANRRAFKAVKGLALLYVGRIHDVAGRRAEALKIYRQVVDDFEEERAGDLARVGLVTPYKRPQP